MNSVLGLFIRLLKLFGMYTQFRANLMSAYIGNSKEACLKKLGVSGATLYKWLKAFDIPLRMPKK